MRVIRSGLSDMQPQKPGRGKPVRDLIRQLLVTEVEESLNFQRLEIYIQWFAPGGDFPLGLAQDFGQNGAKHLEVNLLSQLLQGDSQTAQRGKSLAFIKKKKFGMNSCGE